MRWKVTSQDCEQAHLLVFYSFQQDKAKPKRLVKERQQHNLAERGWKASEWPIEATLYNYCTEPSFVSRILQLKGHLGVTI